jgi:formylglycine-generating enzyme required for sulfatase activity
VFPWGEGADPERANYGDTGIGTTSAVGCFPGGASPYEVEDLSGNVWEWCRTKWRDDYRDYEDDNDPQGNAPRVLRGGAFGRTENPVRCAVRDFRHPGFRGRYGGLRVVVSPFRRAQHGIPLDAEVSGL